MKVKLLYFAKIKELVGLDNETIDLPAHVVTLHELKNYLILRGAPWNEIFLSQNATRCALNQNFRFKGRQQVVDQTECVFKCQT